MGVRVTACDSHSHSRELLYVLYTPRIDIDLLLHTHIIDNKIHQENTPTFRS